MAEVEDSLRPSDFALADSFINFDYMPDIPVQNVDDGSDNWVGSGSRSSDLDCPSNNIAKGIEKISLVEIGGNGSGDVSDEIKVDNVVKDESESSESESVSDTATSSSSFSASSSGDSDEEPLDEKREIEEGEIVDSDAVGNDDDGEEGPEEMTSWGILNYDDDDYYIGDDDHYKGGRIKSRNELEILPLVPPVNVTLEPHHQMLPVGVVMSILGAQVIVEGVAKHDPLREGSILWMTESRTPLGLIDEIFGPVKNPYYIVRFNSEKEVPEGIHGGTLISCVPEFASHLLNNKDLYRKGYDTSGVNDEEVSDEAEFSDDEKEAEYRRMQRMTKRGINSQNPGRRKNNRKKVPQKDGFVPAFPVAPATPLLDHGHCSSFSAIGQGLSGATNAVPPFPPTNAGPNSTASGVWTNGTALPLQQSAMLPNGYPTNGVLSWYLENNQIPHQLPVVGIPFQQQLNPNHGFPPPPIFPTVQPNIFAQPMLSSLFPQIQPHINFPSSSIPFNQYTPHQFNPGASANRGRKTFQRGGRKGWRPAK